MGKIINLTQHAASPEQIAAGVVDLTGPARDALVAELTFSDLPAYGQVCSRAEAIAEIALDTGAERAMIGGAPYLMGALEQALWDAGITPVYAFSRRESVEVTESDGSVTKKAVFRHLGFVEVPNA